MKDAVKAEESVPKGPEKSELPKFESTPSSTPIQESKDSNKTLLIIGGVIALLIVLCICFCGGIFAFAAITESNTIVDEINDQIENNDSNSNNDDNDINNNDDSNDNNVEIDPYYSDEETDDAYDKIGQNKESPVSSYPSASMNVDDDPVLGNLNTAKVVLIEFGDYECPFCMNHYKNTHKKLVSEYVNSGELAIVFRDFPLAFHDPAATDEAVASECVHKFGGDDAFFDFHDLVFENTLGNGEGLTQFELEQYSQESGVDPLDFRQCFEADETYEEVQNDISDGYAGGVSGTPSFFVGYLQSDGEVIGVRIDGAIPYSTFTAVIDLYINSIE